MVKKMDDNNKSNSTLFLRIVALLSIIGQILGILL